MSFIIFGCCKNAQINVFQDPAAPGFILSFPQKNSEEKIVDVAEVNQSALLRGKWTVA